MPRLVELLDDGDRHIRRSAAGAPWKINRHPGAIPALVAELERYNDEGPLSAVISIGEIGPAAGEAVPGLIRMLSHGRLLVRKEAARALKKVDPRSMPTAAATGEAHLRFLPRRGASNRRTLAGPLLFAT